MERLTDKIGNTNCVKGCGSNCKYGFQYCRKEDWENCQTISDVIDKLAEYEDLEEQGRLLKLPCKVGDTIYAVGEIVKEYKVLSVSYHSNKATNRSEFCIETLPVNGSRVVVAFYDKEFGKNAFLAKPEAEAKLKELRGNQNEV